jgi:hypothetical protein
MDIIYSLLSAFFTILPFVIVVLFALAIWVFAIWFINSPTAAIGLMVAIFLLETLSLSPLALKLGLMLYPPDLFVILLFPSFLYRLVILKKISAIPRAWWVLGMVQVGLFVWGLLLNGTLAGVDYRPHFYIWLGAAYLATFDYDEAWALSFLKYFTIMGVGVCSIAYFRWIMGEIDYKYYHELLQIDSTGVGFQRVVASGPMFITACALLVSAYQAITDRTKPMAWILAVLFGVTILAMQHRSVWMGTFAGIIALAWALGRKRAGVGSKFISLGLVLGLVLVVIVASGKFGGAVDSVQQQAERATSTTSGTFVGRVGGWQSLLKLWVDSHSPVTYLVGKPFGGGYERYEYSASGTKKVGFMPHNYYVQLLFRGGLIGFCAYFLVVGKAIRILLVRIQGMQDSGAPLLFAMLVAQLVYYIPYGVDYAQMILLGLLLGMISCEQQKSKALTVRSLQTQTINRFH